jgi:monooxygenase
MDQAEGDRRRAAHSELRPRDRGGQRHRQKIRFNHRVKRAFWSSADTRWMVEAERTAGEWTVETVRFTCNFLFVCSGYYRYEEGYTPEFAGIAEFAGRIVHRRNGLTA